MSRPLRLHAPGLLHHVFARGNEKACIFADDRDHTSFLELLADSLPRFATRCAAYCLLWNHYHLLLVPNEHRVSRLLQQLNSTYCQGFNRRHNRVGHVLQGRFGCRIVEDGAYARTVLRYLALNPVAAGRAATAEDWPWSSYRFVLGRAECPTFLSLQDTWNAFATSDGSEGRSPRLLLPSVAIHPSSAGGSSNRSCGDRFVSADVLPRGRYCKKQDLTPQLSRSAVESASSMVP